MERLREPVSVRQVVVIALIAAGPVLAQLWIGHLPGGGWLALVFVLQFLVQPVTTLLHELGHALAVALLGRRPAVVTVGRGPWATAKCGHVTVRFGLMPSRGVRLRGLCVYDPSGLPWRSIAWISLAGPIATAMTLAAVLAVTPRLWPLGVLSRYLTVSTLVMLAGSLVVNLSPRQPRPHAQAASVGRRDGWTARYALDCARKGTAPPNRRRASPKPESSDSGSTIWRAPELPAEERGALETALMNELEQPPRTNKPT